MTMKNGSSHITAEPYRLFFAGGSLWALISLAIWFCYFLSLKFSHISLSPTAHPGLIHFFSMLFGVIGFYVAGFVLTAFPKWMGESPFEERQFLALFFLQSAAQILGLAGAFASPSLFKFGFWMEGLFQLCLLAGLLRKLIQSRAENKAQAFFVVMSLAAGFISWALALTYLHSPTRFILFELGVYMGSLAYLLTLILAVTSRIIPFFSSKVLSGFSAIPNRRFLPISFTCSLLLCFIQVLPWEGKAFLLIPVKLFLFFFLIKRWLSWKPFSSKSQPLLFVLHIAWAWIFIYLTLSIVADLFFAQNFRMQFSFLHAFSIGCAMSLLVGISTRVARGHGGYPLLLDRPAAITFALLQLAALWRIACPLLGLKWGVWNHLTSYSSLIAMAAFALWCLAYWPLLFRNAGQRA